MLCTRTWKDDTNGINFVKDEIYEIKEGLTILKTIKLSGLYEICGLTVSQETIDDYFINLAEYRDRQIQSILEDKDTNWLDKTGW